jgi:hypothetical protein
LDCYLFTEVASAESIFTNNGSNDDGDAVLSPNDNVLGFYILHSYTVVKKYRGWTK